MPLMRYRDLKHRGRALNAARVWAAEARAELSVTRRQNAPARVLLLCHSLEKGMSNPTPRQGFGVAKARTLVDELIEWEARDGACVRQSFEWMEACAVLVSYFRTPSNHNVSAIRQLAGRFEQLAEPAIPLPPAGAQCVSAPALPPGMETVFEDFIESRHSVRYFSEEPVDETTLLRAIEMAGHSPSACNRQPTRVYYTMDPILNAQIGDLVPGNAPSRGRIPIYLILTYDRKFFEPYETFQWLINAGIFAGYLSLEDSIKLDLRYVQNWSLLGDVVIIIKTVKSMIISQGAY